MSVSGSHILSALCGCNHFSFPQPSLQTPPTTSLQVLAYNTRSNLPIITTHTIIPVETHPYILDLTASVPSLLQGQSPSFSWHSLIPRPSQKWERVYIPIVDLCSVCSIYGFSSECTCVCQPLGKCRSLSKSAAQVCYQTLSRF